MADDINGVGFQIADEIASKVGIHTDSDFRVRSGILHVLTRISLEGHVYLPKMELLARTVELLGVSQELVEKLYHGSGSRTQADTQRAGEADLRIWDQCLLHGIEYSKNAP